MTIRHFIRAAAAAATLTAITAPAIAEHHAETDTAAREQAAIDQVREDFMNAMSAGDFAALGALAHPDFIQVMPGGPEHLAMFAAAGNAPFPPGYSLDITPQELVILNEDWAYEFGTTIISWQPEGADEPATIPNTYLMLLKKENGAWKPYREVASALPPPSGWPKKAGGE